MQASQQGLIASDFKAYIKENNSNDASVVLVQREHTGQRELSPETNEPLNVRSTGF